MSQFTPRREKEEFGGEKRMPGTQLKQNPHDYVCDGGMEIFIGF